MLLILALIVLSTLQARPPAVSASPRASIDGTVIRGDRTAAGGADAKLANVQVVLKPGNVSTTTDASGAFSFRNLTPGRYTISVTRDGYMPLEDPKRGITVAGLSITLKPGEALRDIVIPMIRTPALSGEVFGPHGEALAAALVQAYLRQYTPDGPRVKIAKKTLTNDLGVFRLFGLSFGEYMVSAGYSDRDRASAIGSVRLSANVAKADEGYATAFYGAEGATPQPVQLAPGADPGKLNIYLNVVPRFNIRGRIVPAIADTNIIFAQHGSSLGDAGDVIKPSRDGQFEIRGVSPGSYILLATATDFASDMIPITVGTTNIGGLTVPMVPTVNLTGHFMLEGRFTLDLSASRVRISRSRVVADHEIESPVSTDGTFSLMHVGPWEYDIALEPLPPGTYINSIWSGRVNVLAGNARLSRDQPLQIVLSVATAAVEGIAVKRGDPAGGMEIVLVPDNALRRRTDRYIAGITDATGKFQLNAVPPGRYTAYAFEHIERGAFYAFAYSSAATARFADRGVAVEVRGSSPPPIQLEVIPASETAGGL